MTEAEFAEIARVEIERGIAEKLAETDDPLLAALLVRDRAKIVAAVLAASLKASAPAFRADAERERLQRAGREGAVH